MSTNVYIHSEDAKLEFDCDESEIEKPIIWIRSRPYAFTAALNLSRDDRAKLRAALDRADAIADKA